MLILKADKYNLDFTNQLYLLAEAFNKYEVTEVIYNFLKGLYRKNERG